MTEETLRRGTLAVDVAGAAAALDTVARSRRRAGVLRGYAGAGDVVIAWGGLWLVANAVMQVRPALAAMVWALGIAAITGWSMARARGRRDDWRVLAAAGIAVAYLIVLLAVVRADPGTAALLIALLVAAAYGVAGLWAGARFAVLGLMLAAVALGGWLVVPQWLFLCLALGGGGALIAGGWWLKRA